MLGLESLFSKIKIEIFLQKKDGFGEGDSTFPHYCLTLFYSLSIYCASSSHILCYFLWVWFLFESCSRAHPMGSCEALVEGSVATATSKLNFHLLMTTTESDEPTASSLCHKDFKSCSQAQDLHDELASSYGSQGRPGS